MALLRAGRGETWVLALVAGVALAGCLEDGAPRSSDDSSGDASPADPSRPAGSPRETSPDSPPVASDAAGPRILLVNATGQVSCAFRPTEVAVSASCNPYDPAPYDDADRKPWAAQVDLTEERMTTLGIDVGVRGLIVRRLSWGPNAGVGDTFEVCRTHFVAGVAGEDCWEVPEDNRTSRELAYPEYVFGPPGGWEAARVYDVWVRPTPWTEDLGAPDVTTMEDWSFRFEVWYLGPSPPEPDAS